MTLDDLKKRATAAELTLIEATEAEVKEAARSEVKRSVMNFIRGNPPPDQYSSGNPHEAFQGWFSRMEEHFNQTLK